MFLQGFGTQEVEREKRQVFVLVATSLWIISRLVLGMLLNLSISISLSNWGDGCLLILRIEKEKWI